MTNLFLIDDHSFINDGIKAALQNYNHEYYVAGSATSGDEAIEKLKTLSIDVIILDIVMPEKDGITLCREIKGIYPHIKIIAFTGENDPSLLFKIWMEGSDAILIKDCGTEILANTISSVLRGTRVIGKNVPFFFEECEPDDSKPKLTHSEIGVLKLLGTGLKRIEVAEELCVSKYTIDFHCKNINRKFNSNRINDVIREAKNARIIK